MYLFEHILFQTFLLITPGLLVLAQAKSVQNTNTTSFNLTSIANDNPPIIDTVSLSTDESKEKGVMIDYLEAHHADETGNNSKIIFKILSVTSLGINKLSADDFRISLGSRKYSISSKIDLKGYYGEYLLEIMAEDFGMPSSNDIKNISLTIKKYNFNPPKFIFPVDDIIHLKMGIGVGEKLITSNETILPPFQAVSDPEGKYNAKIELTDSTKIFELNHLGYLRYKSLPNEREKYQFTLTARDDGSPSRSTDIKILIKFENFGDEPSNEESKITIHFGWVKIEKIIKEKSKS